MAKLKDYIPDVIYAIQQAGGRITQTNLTEAVWGTSGRGNTTLTNKMFPAMVDLGLINMEVKGRSKIFSVTPKGIELSDRMCKERGYTAEEARQPVL